MPAAVRIRIALVLAAALAAAALGGCVPGTHAVDLAQARLAGPRLLVIAPHPDDETLAAGGAIWLARRQGYNVTVVFVTAGDGFIQAVRRSNMPTPTAAQMQAFGRKRMAEARHASAALGVPSRNVIFLGFADASLKTLWTSSFEPGRAAHGGNGSSRVPYAAAYRPGAPYTGTELLGELESIVRSQRPTTVIYPDPSDANRDHWAVSAFTQTALLATGYEGRRFTYLVHRPGFPSPRGLDPSEVLEPPAALVGPATSWVSLSLGSPALAAKRAALSAYHTQLASDGRLLLSFVRPNELFAMEPSPSVAATEAVLGVCGAGMPKVVPPPAAQVRSYVVAGNSGLVTVSARTLAPAQPDINYLVHARAILPDGALRFWDASVKDGRVVPTRVCSLDVGGGSRDASVSANSVGVALPASLTRGARWLLVSVDTSAPAGALLDHGPWRAVRLAQ